MKIEKSIADSRASRETERTDKSERKVYELHFNGHLVKFFLAMAKPKKVVDEKITKSIYGSEYTHSIIMPLASFFKSALRMMKKRKNE